MHRLQRASRGSDTDRGGRDDPLEVGILLQQGQRLVKAGLVIVVAIGDLDQFHIGVLRCQFLLHKADPGVLVRSCAGRRENRNLTGAIDLLGQQIHLAAANLLAIGLVDKHVARIGRHISVKTHDLDSLRHGLLQGRCDGIGIIARDDDGADMLLGEGRNERHLSSRVGCGRADLFELSAQGRSSQLTPFGGSVEIRVIDLLGQEHDVEVTPCTSSRSSSSSAGSASTGCQHQQHKNQKTGSQCLKQPFHCLLLYTCFELPAARRRRVKTTEMRRAMLGPSTERINSKPIMRLWISPLIFSRPNTFCKIATMKIASTTPNNEPRPPKMLTPPSKTTVTTVSSNPTAFSGRALEKRAVKITPASAAMTPERMNSSSFTRLTFMPEKRAASLLLPMAKSCLPTRLKCNTTPKITARMAKIKPDQGISVPGIVPNPRLVKEVGKLLTA